MLRRGCGDVAAASVSLHGFISFARWRVSRKQVHAKLLQHVMEARWEGAAYSWSRTMGW